ncbi:MAG: hypothetical protein Q9161_001559 [Pseudevernia consocians]
MAARQRLRAVLEVRRASRPCWRCALNQSRYNFSSLAGIPVASNSTDTVPYDQIPSREFEYPLRPLFCPDNLVHVEPAPARRSNGSEIRSSQTVHKLRERGMSDGHLGTLGIQPQSASTQAVQKPRIRLISPRSSVLRAPEVFLSKPNRDLDLLIRTHICRDDTSTRTSLETDIGKNLPPQDGQDNSVDTEAKSSIVRRTSYVSDVRIIRQVNYDSSWSYILCVAKGDDATPIIHKAGPPLGERPIDASKVSSKGQRRVNDVRVIHKVNQDSPQTEWPFILYVAEGDDATPLIHKAGPLLGERSIDAGKEVNQDTPQTEWSYILYVAEGDNATPLIHKAGPPWSQRPIGTSKEVNQDSPQIGAPYILYMAEGDDATRLIHKAGPPLGEHLIDASKEVNQDSPQFKRPYILYVAEGDDATPLIHKAGPLLGECSIDASKEVNQDTPQTKWSQILYTAEGDNATPLIHKAGPPLGERSIDQPRVKDIDDALTSLLDDFNNHHTSKFSDPNSMTGEPISSTRFSPQDFSARQAASSGIRIPDLLIQAKSRSLFPTRTSRAPSRHYATASSQDLRANAQIDPAIIGTNRNEHFKGESGGIREALRLWQDQHDIALADTSSQTHPSTLSDTQNLFTQSREDESFTVIARDDEVEDNDDVIFGSDEPTPDIFAHQVFLRRGDLVELTWVLRRNSGKATD